MTITHEQAKAFMRGLLRPLFRNLIPEEPNETPIPPLSYERAFELLEELAQQDALAKVVLAPIFERLKQLERDSARINWIDRNEVQNYIDQSDAKGRAWTVLADFPNQTLREAIDSCAKFDEELRAYIQRGKR